MDVKAILRMIVERYEQKSLLPPMKTRLIKLLYLTELEYYRRTGKRLTSLAWQFYHFGPYASALEPYIGDLNSTVNGGLLAEMLSKYPGEKSLDDRSHFPIAELQLRSEENLYVYKGSLG